MTNVNKTITSEIIVAYAQCPRKAHMLLYSDEKGAPHEYVRILEQRRFANRDAYLISFGREHLNLCPYSIDSLRDGSDFCIHATLRAGVFEATCGILTKVALPSLLGEHSYEPTTFVGTHRISKDQKLELFFAAYALEQIQGTLPMVGRIVGMGPKSHKVKLESSGKTLAPLLEDLQEWTQATFPEAPTLVLNKHCPYCQFRRLCWAQAEREDNLSLLDRVTAKVIRRYEKKGIFTVKQLSYLYKPRRRKKRTRNPPPAVHKPELQALAIRTGKIYLQDLPELTRKPVELFLDIEGVPDEQYHYLVGLLVCEGDTCTDHSFWADTREDEVRMWRQFVERVNQYSDVPIYHYGSYESRAVAKLTRRYKTDSETLKSRLVNVNTHIYGKVYFPVRSNRLKDIGAFIGATWTSSNASGLQSLVWRSRWDETRDARYQDLLITYNREDCQALKLLTDELSKIEHSADTLSEVDFADQPKRYATELGTELHSQFRTILKLAHADYDKKKISLRQGGNGESGGKRKHGAQKGHPGYSKVVPEPDKVVYISEKAECPEHKGELEESEEITAITIVDLVFIESGIKKTITKYVGEKRYCRICRRSYTPPKISPGNIAFGHGFRAWVIYHRLFLRLPYRVITQALVDQFNEKMSEGTISNFLRYFGNSYSETEQILTQRILESSFVHIDETKINIRGVEQYVWVFTDGKHVVFKLTETREAEIVHKFLAGYSGILVSDFYPGYDSIKCEQQKCWVHLIRDINDDLWKAPFDIEFEGFVLGVRNLIVPILATVEECGPDKEHLGKFNDNVCQFYEETISKSYRSELTLKYQSRFLRYRESLFTFLKYDAIPWNNNMAERALRHLAVQRKISGCFFESVAPQYLLLLGIMQTCRFQGKSFLKFLLSGEKDIDRFQQHD